MPWSTQRWVHHGSQRLRGRHRPAQATGRSYGAFLRCDGCRPHHRTGRRLYDSRGRRLLASVLLLGGTGLHGLSRLALRSGEAAASENQVTALVTAYGHCGH
jgi:hypothetical protein